MPNDPLKHKVRAVVERILGDRQAAIGDADDLFAIGLDSISAMLLIAELEENLGIEISGEDLDYRHFSSIDHITVFLGRLSARNG